MPFGHALSQNGSLGHFLTPLPGPNLILASQFHDTLFWLLWRRMPEKRVINMKLSDTDSIQRTPSSPVIASGRQTFLRSNLYPPTFKNSEEDCAGNEMPSIRVCLHFRTKCASKFQRTLVLSFQQCRFQLAMIAQIDSFLDDGLFFFST